MAAVSAVASLVERLKGGDQARIIRTGVRPRRGEHRQYHEYLAPACRGLFVFPGQVAVLLGALRNGRAVSCIIELVFALYSCPLEGEHRTANLAPARRGLFVFADQTAAGVSLNTTKFSLDLLCPARANRFLPPGGWVGRSRRTTDPPQLRSDA